MCESVIAMSSSSFNDACRRNKHGIRISVRDMEDILEGSLEEQVAQFAEHCYDMGLVSTA